MTLGEKNNSIIHYNIHSVHCYVHTVNDSAIIEGTSGDLNSLQSNQVFIVIIIPCIHAYSRW